MTRMRIQKILAAAGLGSRRACEALIEEGRIAVDGALVTRLGAQADPDLQVVSYDGTPLKMPKKFYYLLNKPVGFLCTNTPDRSGRPLAVDLIKGASVRLFCVGRLDVDSKGALIITNDGDLSNYVTHPRYDIPKTYRVRVAGHMDDVMLERLRKGVWLSEGRTGSIEVKVIRTTRKDSLLRLVIKEGKNRIIRRIMAKLELRVTELERTRIGSLALGSLKAGTYRLLSNAEVNIGVPLNHLGELARLAIAALDLELANAVVPLQYVCTGRSLLARVTMLALQ